MKYLMQNNEHYLRHVIEHIKKNHGLFAVYAKYKFYLNSRGRNVLEDSRVSVVCIVLNTNVRMSQEGLVTKKNLLIFPIKKDNLTILHINIYKKELFLLYNKKKKLNKHAKVCIVVKKRSCKQTKFRKFKKCKFIVINFTL